MSDLSEVQAGDTLLLVADRREPKEVAVAKVGRTLLYVTEYGRARPFRRADGVQNDHQFGTADRVYTIEGWAERAHRADVASKLKALGIEPAGYGDFKYSTATLEELVVVLERENAAPEEER